MVDPTGLWFGIDDLIVLGLAMNNAFQGGGDYGATIENYFKQYYSTTFQMVIGGPFGLIGGITYEIGDYFDNAEARSVGLAFTGFGIGGIFGAINGGVSGYYNIYDFESADFFGNGIGAFFLDSINPIDQALNAGTWIYGYAVGGEVSKELSKGSGQIWIHNTGSPESTSAMTLGHTVITGKNESEVRASTKNHEPIHSAQSRIFNSLYYISYLTHMSIAALSAAIIDSDESLRKDSIVEMGITENKYTYNYLYQYILHKMSWWELWAESSE